MNEQEAIAFIESKIFTQRVDKKSGTHYEVINKFSVEKISGVFDLLDEANGARDELRRQKLLESRMG